jgi:hypothetical protein
MPPAAILTAASKSNTTGGTFADTLTANAGDTLSIPTYNPGAARIVSIWGGTKTAVAEFEMYSTRTEGFHDTVGGFRWSVPLGLAGTGSVSGAFTAIADNVEIPVFPADTITIKATTTASDNAAVVYETVYDDLPGVGAAQFTDWTTIQSLYDGSVGIEWGPTCSGTAGAWGASRALTADDNRFQGLRWYALLGVTVRTPIAAIGFISNLWGGQRVGLPAGAANLNNSTWFVDRSQKHNMPLIPYFNQADAANILGYAMDVVASTTPLTVLNIVRLTGKPGG